MIMVFSTRFSFFLSYTQIEFFMFKKFCAFDCCFGFANFTSIFAFSYMYFLCIFINSLRLGSFYGFRHCLMV